MTQVQSAQQASANVPTAPAPVPALPFPPAEWQSFRDEDKHAGTAIVCIMLGIFSIGLILYAAICLVAASG
jgi:hypothetical protein